MADETTELLMPTQTDAALNSRETNIPRRPSLQKLAVRVAALERSFREVTPAPGDFLSALFIAALRVSCTWEELKEIQALALPTGEIELPVYIRDSVRNVLEQLCQSHFGMTYLEFLLAIAPIVDGRDFVFDRAPQPHTASPQAEGDASR